MQCSTMFMSVDFIFRQSRYELVIRSQVERGYLHSRGKRLVLIGRYGGEMLDLFHVPAQGGRIEHALSGVLIAVWEMLEYGVQGILESHVQQAISLIQYDGLNGMQLFSQISRPQKVEEPTGCCNEDIRTTCIQPLLLHADTFQRDFVSKAYSA